LESFLSIITPTYNSEKVIGSCLDSVCAQDYPKDLFEVIIADAGSKDRTIDIVNSYKDRLDIKIFPNALKTGEAGKTVGIDNAKGDIVGLIDSDNVMRDREYIKKMMKPFDTMPDIMGTEPLYFEYRKEDKPLTRYFAMSGVNDPLCLFIGNYDKYSYITGKWTGMKLKTQEDQDAVTIYLDEKAIPTIGANGTFLKKELIKKTHYSPYMFDIDVVYEIIKTGVNKFVKVKTGIVHIYSPDISSFIKKQSRRVNDFLFFADEKKRTYPWSSFPAGGVILFTLYCAVILPLLWQALKGFVRKPDWAWIFHPLVCWITLFIYGTTFIKAKITGKSAIKDREKW
jgi:glycosyltransferase involved in cell wall biosynthesis